MISKRALFFVFLTPNILNSFQLQAMRPDEPAAASSDKDRNQEQMQAKLRAAFVRCDRVGVADAIANGADPNFVDMNGDSLLHLTIEGLGQFFELRKEHLPMTRLLMERGANHRLRNAKGQTPIELIHAILSANWANETPYLLGLRDMLELRDRETALLATMPPQGTLLARLPADLQHVIAQIAAPIMNRAPKLFYAIAHDDVDGVKRALSQGEDPNAVNKYGTPAIMLAALRRNVNVALEIIGVFDNYVLDLNPTRNGRTLLEHLRALPDRQRVADELEIRMRNRGIIVSTPQKPATSWLSRFFPGSSGR